MKNPLQLVVRVVQHWSQHDGWEATAAIAYHATLALLPTAILGIQLIAWLLGQQRDPTASVQQLSDAVASGVSPWVADQLTRLLDHVRTDRATGGGLGIVGLLVAALGVYGHLEAAFHKIWEQPRRAAHGWRQAIYVTFRTRVLAFVMLLAGMLFLIVASAANTAVAAVAALAPEQWTNLYLLELLRLAVSWLLSAVLFAIGYRALPPAKVSWRDAALAGSVVAAFWEFGRRAIELFALRRRYGVYGVLGGLLALMVWIYYASAVVLLGAQLLREIEQPPAESVAASPGSRA